MNKFLRVIAAQPKLLFGKREIYCSPCVLFCQKNYNYDSQLKNIKTCDQAAINSKVSSGLQKGPAIKCATNFNNVDKSQDLRENIYTIPNALCLTRILLSPVLGYMVVYEYYFAALGVFTFAGLTDLLDGFIARKFPSQMSNLGSAIDPVADKVLVSVLVLSLTYMDLFPLWLTSIIILRDVILLLGGLYIRYITLESPKTMAKFFDVTQSSTKMKPTTISKINTAVQLFTVAATLSSPIFGFVDHYFLNLCWYITASTTVLSGLSYVFIDENYERVKKQ